MDPPYSFKLIPRNLTWTVKDVKDIVRAAQEIPELAGMEPSHASEGGFMWKRGKDYQDIRTQWSTHICGAPLPDHTRLLTRRDEQGFPFLTIQPKRSVSLAKLSAFLDLVARQGHLVEATFGFRQTPRGPRQTAYAKKTVLCRKGDKYAWAKMTVNKHTERAFYEIFQNRQIPPEITTIILRFLRAARPRFTHINDLNKDDRRRYRAAWTDLQKCRPNRDDALRALQDTVFAVSKSSESCYMCTKPTQKMGRFCLEHLECAFLMEDTEL